MSDHSEEWYKARYGKFTSSNIHSLMGAKGLGDTGRTYAFELAVEILHGRDLEDNYVSFDMNVGIEREPYAFDQFKQNKSLQFLTVEPCSFKALGDNTGSTPDGIVSDNSGLEIKCPKSKNFFRIVATNEVDKKWYDQMQHQMYVWGFKQTYFFTYTIYNSVPMWHEIVFQRDEERIELMKSRISEATTIRDEFVEAIKRNRQYLS